MTKIKNLPQNHATSRLPNTITLSPQWKPTWSGEGAYLRGFTSASTRRARWRDAATYDHSKQIFPMLMPRKRKRKNLDQSPIFSTFSLLPGFRPWLTYILYQHIFFSWAQYINRFLSSLSAAVCRVSSLEEKYDIFGKGNKETTAQKMKFSVKGFFSKCDQIRRKVANCLLWTALFP